MSNRHQYRPPQDADNRFAPRPGYNQPPPQGPMHDRDRDRDRAERDRDARGDRYAQQPPAGGAREYYPSGPSGGRYHNDYNSPRGYNRPPVPSPMPPRSEYNGRPPQGPQFAAQQRFADSTTSHHHQQQHSNTPSSRPVAKASYNGRVPPPPPPALAHSTPSSSNPPTEPREYRRPGTTSTPAVESRRESFDRRPAAEPAMPGPSSSLEGGSRGVQEKRGGVPDGIVKLGQGRSDRHGQLFSIFNARADTADWTTTTRDEGGSCAAIFLQPGPYSRPTPTGPASYQRRQPPPPHPSTPAQPRQPSSYPAPPTGPREPPSRPRTPPRQEPEPEVIPPTPVAATALAPAAPVAPAEASFAPTSAPTEIYERLVQVGEGTYGKVYKARNVETGALVAMKRIRMEAEKDGFPVTAIREIKLLQSLSHRNVVGLIEMLVSRGHVYMVFDYLEHDLTGILHHPSIKLTPAHLKSLMHQFLDGLGFIHRRGVLHRDLKGSNILLSKHGELKIADFGLARFYKRGRNNDYTNRVITQWYKPPELLFGATVYGAEVDMWSAGCIFLELFTQRPVFQGLDEIHQLEVIFKVTGTPSVDTWPGVEDLPWYELVKPKAAIESVLRETYSEWLTPGGLDVAEALLSLNPALRPTAEEALKMPYFTTEEPKAQLPEVLSTVKGEWHELESKRARKRQREEGV
ncbi:cyclin-dependent protein kinase [Pseudohyphozyma bogoriensis]|nr:cyclin-dependent protein kinase [Pseudohyphozyma bogoriensis]